MNVSAIGAYTQQPYYKNDQINGLKAQESSYEAELSQLKAGDEEKNASALQETESRLASIESQLDALKPVTAVKPQQHIEPPTDEEMNARFGEAYSVELSNSVRLMDR